MKNNLLIIELEIRLCLNALQYKQKKKMFLKTITKFNTVNRKYNFTPSDLSTNVKSVILYFEDSEKNSFNLI